MNTNYLMKCEHFYEGKVIPFVMEENESIDIDDYKDLIAAENAIKNLNKN